MQSTIQIINTSRTRQTSKKQWVLQQRWWYTRK